MKSNFKATLRKPKKAAYGVRSNRVKCRFRRTKPGDSINFELYRIRKIDGALSHQKFFRKDKEMKSIFEI